MRKLIRDVFYPQKIGFFTPSPVWALVCIYTPAQHMQNNVREGLYLSCVDVFVFIYWGLAERPVFVFVSVCFDSNESGNRHNNPVYVVALKVVKMGDVEE